MPPNSSDVNSGDQALATQYNNLRADVLNTSSGHTHNGTDSKVLSMADGTVYTNVQTDYVVLTGANFTPAADTSEWVMQQRGVQSKSNTDSVTLYAAVNFPRNGVTITSVKAFWYRTDAAATGTLKLSRVTLTDGSDDDMAIADSDESGGNHDVEDTSITYPVVDKTTYGYMAHTVIDPNDDADEVILRAVLITFTYTKP